jgi:hypothetical protein
MFVVKSQNFDFHQPIQAETFASAIKAAKKRGYEARIETANGELAASWSPLYGTHIIDRNLAGLSN